MTPWLFGIGTSKSGGHSLVDALSLLGLTAKHVGHELFEGRRELLATLQKNASEGLRPLDGIVGIDAIVDWPMSELWPAVRDSYPDSKFVVTYRQPHKCALSWCRMLLAQPDVARDQDITTYSGFVQHVEGHVDFVLSSFLECPDRLLILDMDDDDATKWRLLAHFVGSEPPRGVPFPRSFSHAEWELDTSIRQQMREFKG
jgi:hypothetical protein